jgi:hypothetical protein
MEIACVVIHRLTPCHDISGINILILNQKVNSSFDPEDKDGVISAVPEEQASAKGAQQ